MAFFTLVIVLFKKFVICTGEIIYKQEFKKRCTGNNFKATTIYAIINCLLKHCDVGFDT